MGTRIPWSAAAVCALLLLAGCSGGGGSAVPTTGTQGGTQAGTTGSEQAELDAFLLQVHPVQAATLVRLKAARAGLDEYVNQDKPTKAVARTQGALVVRAGEQMQAVSRRISAVVAPVALKAAWARYALGVRAYGKAITSLGTALKAQDSAAFTADAQTLLQRAAKAGRFYDALIRYSVADQLTLPDWVKNPRY